MKTFKIINSDLKTDTVTIHELHNVIKRELDTLYKDEFSLNFARNVINSNYKFITDTEEKKALFSSIQDNTLENIKRVKRGTYKFNDDKENNAVKPKVAVVKPPKEDKNIKQDNNEMSLVPLKSSEFVPHGCYDVIKTVISKNVFAPIWVAGESGNGKTFGVEQACAAVGRELVILNISNETSEEDLIGSYVLDTENSYEIEMSEEDYQKYLGLIS